MSAPKILAFAGSLRAGSYNKQLVKIAAQGAQSAGAEVTVIDLRDFPLPIFDEDLEAAGTPLNANRLKTLMLDHQGLLIASPEYNSSFSAALKNVIDWVSRPIPGKPRLACYVGKIAGVMSASTGNLGGLRGQFQLRTLLANLNVLVLPDMVTLSAAQEAFDGEGRLKDSDKHAAVQALGAKVAETVRRLS